MKKKLFLVLVAVGLILFISLEADAEIVVSKQGSRKEKIGNQLVVKMERMTKMKTMNEVGYDEKIEEVNAPYDLGDDFAHKRHHEKPPISLEVQNHTPPN